MAIASVVPLASKLHLRRSLICSTRQRKPLRRTIPTPGMGRTMRPFPINMSLRTTISEDDAIPRRTGNHHLNLWDDDFIQSLSTPYGGQQHSEKDFCDSR